MVRIDAGMDRVNAIHGSHQRGFLRVHAAFFGIHAIHGPH